MFLCDTSVVDWDAVGAVGTWVIGAAAIWAAFQANAIAVRLRRAQDERNMQVARAMLIGLRLEALHYAKRLKGFSETLQRIARMRSADPLSPQLEGLREAGDAFRMMQNVTLSDVGHRITALASVPQHLAEEINSLYANERTNRTVFQNNAELIHGSNPLLNPMLELKPKLRTSGEEIKRSADQVLSTVNAISTYLGLPAEEL